MSQIIEQAKASLKEAVMNALGRAVAEGLLPAEPIPPFSVEVPADRKNGDFSVNAAMVSARAFHKSPREIAAVIMEKTELSGTYADRCEVAGPGFLNFYLSDRYYADVLCDIASKGKEYGKSDFGGGKRVLVEFVSANPTGPMHIGNARGGALGDGLSSVLDAAGYRVSREFYVNDAGNQIEKFGLSLDLRYLQLFDPSVELPEDSYHGEDIIDHAKEFAKIHGDNYVNKTQEERRKALVDFALPKNIAKLKSDLELYRIHYDNWFTESSLHESGAVDEVLAKLRASGHTYEQEGALWFRATDFGVDKDFVLVRANGIPTYVVPDIAYHYNKLVTRGFDKAIDILGADHHGYVPRLKAALTALSVDADRLDAIIMQMVRLVRGGEVIKASKRSGKAITLVTLLDEVPIDAARFFFNQREPNSHFDFDLDLAVEQTAQNPVYYVQYAHARICSIFKNLKAEGELPDDPAGAEDLLRLTQPEERELIRHLAGYTDCIIGAAKDYDPAAVTRYLTELATLFHKFYNACRVRTDDLSLKKARLALCTATKTVLCNALALLGITAPEVM